MGFLTWLFHYGRPTCREVIMSSEITAIDYIKDMDARVQKQLETLVTISTDTRERVIALETHEKNNKDDIEAIKTCNTNLKKGAAKTEVQIAGLSTKVSAIWWVIGIIVTYIITNFLGSLHVVK